MATEVANSVDVPAELLSAAKDYAEREGRPVGDLVEEALRLYMEVDPRMHAMSRVHRARAAALGLTPEEYAVQMVKEARAEMRNEGR
jgi:hypothetical protein